MELSQLYYCGTFDSQWTQEQAEAEAFEQFGVADAASSPDMGIVCDDCYKAITAVFPPEEWKRLYG